MKLRILAAALLALVTAMPAHAVIVSSIRIASSAATWLQVSEVVARTADGTNVALASNGAVASAYSSMGGQNAAAMAIDGNMFGAYSYSDTTPGIYHSGDVGPQQYLLITLASAFDIASLTIYGRTDCCRDRDLYVYTLFGPNDTVVSGTLDARVATFATAEFAAADVPEPAGWAMMLAGFGIIGGGMRRRRISWGQTAQAVAHSS